jgi:hypothetical protein
MPLALANDRQLKNFTARIPADHDLANVLLVEFTLDCRRVGEFRTNQELISRELQLMIKAVSAQGEKTASQIVLYCVNFR